MKQVWSIGSLLLALGTCAQAQTPFTNCSAAFVGDKMLVSSYSRGSTCQLPATAKGELSVQTVDLSPKCSKGLDKVRFKVAIRDKATGTLQSFSDETFRHISVQRVLSNCRKGDQIVLLTVDRRYALPHNEIQVR